MTLRAEFPVQRKSTLERAMGIASEWLEAVASSNRDSDLELARLAESAYAELRRLARGYLHRERIDHTLQPTALVNEAYLRLADQKAHWQNRAHFLGTAALL